VLKVFGGLLYMDFDQRHMDEASSGRYVISRDCIAVKQTRDWQLSLEFDHRLSQLDVILNSSPSVCFDGMV